MKSNYLVRLDDACPYMNRKKWMSVENILNKYGIKPLVGIIPHNEDDMTKIEEEDCIFWHKALQWQKNGWTIALHGFNHCYATECGGINPVHKRSEFAGLSYNEQKQKILQGYNVLKDKGLSPTYFFAPSHTFDVNTIKAIREVTPIRLLSDTFARFPYKYGEDFIIVPCQMGRFREISIGGYWTFCFHPNIMDADALAEFESFIDQHKEQFISFSDIPIKNAGTKGIIDKLIEFAYLSLRRIRG